MVQAVVIYVILCLMMLDSSGRYGVNREHPISSIVQINSVSTNDQPSPRARVKANLVSAST